MSFFIKTLKKNIYVNIIIILLCLGMFIKTDYQNIKRYNEGYKYLSTTTTITVFFSITPKEKVFEYPAAERLKNMLKREFKEISFSYRVKESPSISIFGFSINQFDTDKFEEIENRVKNVMKNFLEQEKKILIENFKKTKENIMIESELNETEFENKLKEIYSENFIKDPFVDLKVHSYSVSENLKLGQSKKVKLIKIIISNFIFSIIISLILCFIISILLEDLSKKKIKF